MTISNELIKLRKLLDTGTINKTEFLKLKNDLIGESDYEEISFDTGNLISESFKNIEYVGLKNISQPEDFFYYQKIARLKLHENKITYIFEYDEEKINFEYGGLKRYKRHIYSKAINKKYTHDIYAGEIYLYLDQISQIKVYPDSNWVKTSRDKYDKTKKRKELKAGINIFTPESLFGEVWKMLGGGNPFEHSDDSALGNFSNIKVSFDCLNDESYEKVLDFEKNVIQSMRNQVLYCPECGQTRFFMKQSCNSCQWRYQNIKTNNY